MDIRQRIPTGTTPGPILLALALVAAVNACATDSPAGEPTRETLPNGAALVRYPGLPAIDSVDPEVTEAQVDLRFGTREGDDPNFLFGDIRGIQAASDGSIYVLDYQAVEIRAYSRDGAYLRTIVARGEGPGEISEANGILLAGDSILWINDHRKWAIIGVDPAGEEVRRFDMPVRSYGYIWEGTFDDRGRFWNLADHGDEDEGEYTEPEPGLFTESYRSYYKSYDLATGAVDSVYLGDQAYRTHIVETSDGGRWYANIPFEASDITVANPSGGFWHANTASYRLARTSESGDTLVIIEASLPVQPVTEEDRSAYVQGIVDREPDNRRGAEAIAALMPDLKPILQGFFVDDEDRLWVQRSAADDTPPFYDLFSEDGDYLGSVRFAFEPAPYSKLWVLHGNIYTWVVDELDVPSVVRAPVP